VELIWKHARVYTFDIQRSTDGTNWTNVLVGVTSSALSTEWNALEFPQPAQARYLRYVARGSTVNNWTYLTELVPYTAP
jgi:hypothetical protein